MASIFKILFFFVFGILCTNGQNRVERVSSSTTSRPRVVPTPTPTTTTEYSYWESDTPTLAPTVLAEKDDDISFNQLNPRPTSTTARPRPQPSSERYEYRTTTTERSNLWTTRRTTERWQTTTYHYPMAVTDHDHRSHRAPSISFIAENSDKRIELKWDHQRRETIIPTENLRQLKLTLTCNATYPVKWVSNASFQLGKDKWEMDEGRLFEKRQRGRAEVVTYSVFLTLEYRQQQEGDKDISLIEGIPNLDIYCTDIKDPYDSFRKQSLLRISKESSTAVKFRVMINHGEGSQQHYVQYSEPRGANVDCSLGLAWNEVGKRFVCNTERDSQKNVTISSIDYTDINCFDKASCERIYTKPNCNNRGTRTKAKTPMELWGSDVPPSGIVTCKHDGESGNKTIAMPIFHSLPFICPRDNNSTRHKLYAGEDESMALGRSILEDDFVSFCPTDQMPKLDGQNNNNVGSTKVSLFAGEHLNVSCITSIYHFAKGSRIGLVSRSGSIIEYAELVGPKPEICKKLGEGYVNLTARIQIKSADVSGLICETYVKQSTLIIRKKLPLEVKIPRNVTFIGEKANSTVAVLVYTGEGNQELRCEADGDPLPTFKWEKDGKDIPELIKKVDTERSSVLKFPTLGEKKLDLTEMHGTYTCRAEQNKLNDGISIQKSFFVSGSNTSLPVVSPEKPHVEESSQWWIWAIVVPILVLIAAGIIGFLVWKIKRQSQELKLLSKAEVDEFIFGKPEFLQHHASSEEVNNYAPFLPYNRNYEIGKEQLEIDPNGVLGSGAYAVVLRGVFHEGSGNHIKIAIKTSKPMDDVSYFKALLSELKIMGFIGSHSNIVNLVGAYTKNIQSREIYIAIEYCENGSLLAYLRENRPHFKNQVNSEGEFITETSDPPESFSEKERMTTLTLIRWAKEVATGMEFLCQKKVIHGDLAARNILLTEHLVAKIGDFGLSRQLFEYANYIKKQQSPLPWKWLAIECLQDMKFSVKSDVWAYSILNFEIFTLGQVPYPGHSYNDEFLDALLGGKRPNKPVYATKQIYELMSSCWLEKADDRPTFTYIKDYFEETLAGLAPSEYIDLHEKISAETSDASKNGTSSTTAMVHSPPLSAISNDYCCDGNSSGTKPLRFSFNTKTITALFHRD